MRIGGIPIATRLRPACFAVQTASQAASINCWKGLPGLPQTMPTLDVAEIASFSLPQMGAWITGAVRDIEGGVMARRN